ncbi:MULTISPECIES: mobilization protein [Bacillota]|uniref:Mobilization protein n=1 Tax=Anaerococcus kampingae TaxID=3115614 RepID=A0ABW9MDT0_9FIRM
MNLKNQLKIYSTYEEKEIYIIDLEQFRDLQWSLSNATNNINQTVKATNTTGVIYKKDIDYMREKIEKISKELWDVHSLLLRRE